jgi:hypothetical protein
MLLSASGTWADWKIAGTTAVWVIRDAGAHLVVDKVVDFFEGSAIEVAGEGLKLVGQHGTILDADLPPRLETILANQLHRFVLETLERLLRERLHLLLGQLGGAPVGQRGPGRREAPHRATVRSHCLRLTRAQIGLGGAGVELPRRRRRRRRLHAGTPAAASLTSGTQKLLPRGSSSGTAPFSRTAPAAARAATACAGRLAQKNTQSAAACRRAALRTPLEPSWYRRGCSILDRVGVLQYTGCLYGRLARCAQLRCASWPTRLESPGLVSRRRCSRPSPATTSNSGLKTASRRTRRSFRSRPNHFSHCALLLFAFLCLCVYICI